MRHGLELEGYRVLEAVRPDEAAGLAAHDSGSVDVFLTEIAMPGASGPEVAERIRAFRPSVRVLYMSEYTERRIEAEERTELAANLLQKPFTIESLVQKVEEVLAATGSPKKIPSTEPSFD